MNLNPILDAVARHAQVNPEHTALCSGTRSVNYAELHELIWKLATVFIDIDVRVLGLHLDNGIDWVIIDLAAQCAGITLIPLPSFFSRGQIEFIFEKANIDTVISHDRTAIPGQFEINISRNLAQGVNLYKCWHRRENYNSLRNTGKITFTSGTTGYPKGVCLRNDSIAGVAGAILKATKSIDITRHLCLLPLSLLLENIAGVYTPLLKGSICLLPSLNETGLTGNAAGFDVSRMVDCIKQYNPDSMILLPQMLHDLVSAVESGVSFPQSPVFIAVGGGVISASLIRRARSRNLPVYEGYGLSECGSVVALNVPQNDMPGSAGKILDNIEVRITGDNEIQLKGNFMQGYLGGPAIRNNEWLATGDVGKIDEHGYLHITGRKKNIFITSFGRNVSPEWSESELLVSPVIKQTVVFGEARPANCAVIVPVNSRVDDKSIESAIDAANKNLPDYARIYYWVRAKGDFRHGNGMATSNGRPLREKIYRHYEQDIESCYEQLLAGRRV